MSKRSFHHTVAFLLCSGTVHAQVGTDTTSDGSASAAGGVSLSGAGFDASAEDESATASEDASTRSPQDVDNVWEVGLFTGVFFPSPKHKLHSLYGEYQAYEQTAIEFGGRIAYFPLRWVGIEAEFMMADGRLPDDLKHVHSPLDSNRAAFFAYRGHVIGQLPLRRITPFALAGVSALGANSQPLGRDTDTAVHAGLGFKIPLNEWASLRAEARENMHSRYNDSYSGIAFSEEALLGLAFTLGAPKPAPPKVAPPPPDQDRDTVPDAIDKCPTEPALTADGCPPDTDGDGVADPQDECPREPGPAPRGCPELDADGDNVPLPCDRCPEEAGKEPDGCPVRDADGDGVLDDVDKCPNEPETQNGYEDDDGCPDEIPKEVKAFTGTIKGIQFDQGKATIRPNSIPTLKAATEVLQRFGSIRIEVSGHTSSEGDPAFNQKLSEDRAAAVREWLVEQGIAPTRITSRGAGSDEPVADNGTEAGRRQNRRIEFTILTR